MTQLYQRLLLIILFITATAAQAQIQKGIDINGVDLSDKSGYSVSMSSDGNTMAIGAIFDSEIGAGYVRVYTWDGSAWNQKGLDIVGESSYDYSGCSVSLSADGSIVAIGAKHNVEGGWNAGHVRVYFWGLSSWIQKGSDIDGMYKDTCGYSVSLSSDGNTVAISSPRVGDGGDYGIVRVYRWDGDIAEWNQIGDDIVGDAVDYNGFSVSISADGNSVAIGAPFYNTDEFDDTGRVKVFIYNDPLWIQKGVDIEGEGPYYRIGMSVSMSSDGNTVAIGAPHCIGDEEGFYPGRVLVFEWVGMAWVQKGSDIIGEFDDQHSGFSVSLSSDGNTIAIGAPHIPSGEYDNEGKTRLFYWAGDTWLQKGTTINGEWIGDKSGYSVSLSADGNTVAIGSPLNLGNTGQVRVYEFCTEDINVDVNLIATDTLQADNGADGLSYQWIDCKDSSEIAGATAQTYGAEINGEYAVIINQNGCIDTSACTAITEIGVGILENHSNQIKIYPNPSSGIMYFESAGAEMESIKLYNSLGQLVESWAVSGTKTELNLSEFERGIYSVIIETAIGQTRKQIVVR